MAGRKKGGGSGKNHGGNHDDDDLVMEFTPEGGFNIRMAARNFAELMEESNQPLIIHLPHVSVEFEPGCTPKEIIDGYNLAMKAKFVVKPSNTNAGPKGPK
ncbi:MAG: hypothetical protein GC185_09580 [Alphaproteobacteria bacterium]|nr:hypothetical protein [Alphaproteobacteria bacterium]